MIDVDLAALAPVFLAETTDQLRAAEDALIALEENPDDDASLQTVFRAAHTLKGGADGLGYRTVTEFTHTLEDLLQRLVDRAVPATSDVVSMLLEAVDALRELVPAAVSGATELSPPQRALLARIDELAAPRGVRGADRAVQPVAGGDVRSGPAHGGANASSPSIRVETSKLDALLDLAGEIAIANGRLRAELEQTSSTGSQTALETHREADRLYAELQEQVSRIRMVPVGPRFLPYSRVVRDVAKARGKLARLVIHGGDVEVDTAVVEHLRDPLTHMIRNAVDHGIETPEARRTTGKDPCGTIVLRAAHEAGSVLVTLSDDGAGFNRDRIRQRAVASGLLSAREEPPDAELLGLVFHAGFSTANEVTDLSGRGIGLDVVRRNIEALRGTIEIGSTLGRGASFHIRLPLTLASIDGFFVVLNGETFVLPLDAVMECLPFAESGDALHGIVDLRGHALPYVRLRRLFRMTGAAPPREHLVVIRQGERRIGLVVDHLIGENQAVIKPLGPAFRHVPAIAGSTVLGTGRIALILDVPGLLRTFAVREPDLQDTRI